MRDLDDYALKALVPPPIAVRLDQLVDVLAQRARDLGDVSHSELAAALIHSAPSQPAKLASIVLAYRHAHVYATLLDARRKTGRYALPPRKVGRPKRG